MMGNWGDRIWFWRAASFVFTDFIELTLVLCWKKVEENRWNPLHSLCSVKTLYRAIEEQWYVAESYQQKRNLSIIHLFTLAMDK